MSGALSALPPERLRALFDEDRRRRVHQPAVPLDRRRWESATGAAAPDLLTALPDELDRDSVRRFVRSRVADGDFVASFAATQVWGYGATGYGPFRLAEALASPGLDTVLAETCQRLVRGDPTGAFRMLCVENRIPRTGTAFGSKYLYFADPHGQALILDSVVAGWLEEHADVRLRLLRDEAEYGLWLDAAAAWSRDIGTTAERVELLIFTDALREGSAWRPDAE